MNHLAGLQLRGHDPLAELTTSEDLSMFEAFKREYQALVDGRKAGQPEFRVAGNSLLEDGWRPLDDTTLFRFLAADRRKGKFNPEKSMKRLRAALSWRLSIGVDDMSIREPPGIDRYKRVRVRPFAGYDHTGRPVQFERLGQFFASGNWKEYALDEWIRYYAWDQENVVNAMRDASERSGNAVMRYVFCADCAGCGVRNYTDLVMNVVPLVANLAKAVESHFPEIVGTIVMFNVPSVITRLFKVVMVLLDPVTVAKIEVHSGLPMQRLQELMPLEVIPRVYGGRNDIEYPDVLSSNSKGIASPTVGSLQWRTASDLSIPSSMSEVSFASRSLSDMSLALHAGNGASVLDAQKGYWIEDLAKVLLGGLLGIIIPMFAGAPDKSLLVCIIVFLLFVCAWYLRQSDRSKPPRSSGQLQYSSQAISPEDLMTRSPAPTLERSTSSWSNQDDAADRPLDSIGACCCVGR